MVRQNILGDVTIDKPRFAHIRADIQRERPDNSYRVKLLRSKIYKFLNFS